MQYLYNISRQTDEVDFLHAGKHQDFLQVGNIFYGWFVLAWPKYIDNFALSLQHLQREVRKELLFSHPYVDTIIFD